MKGQSGTLPRTGQRLVGPSGVARVVGRSAPLCYCACVEWLAERPSAHASRFERDLRDSCCLALSWYMVGTVLT